jgi:hypothetical protein
MRPTPVATDASHVVTLHEYRSTTIGPRCSCLTRTASRDA